LHPVTPIIDLPGEIWKDIECNPDYAVSNMGRVKSKKYDRHKVLKATKSEGSKVRYLHVSLFKFDISVTASIHVMVAEAFCTGRRNKHYQVNHKDGNTFNNKASNLEWVVPGNNVIHAFNRNGRPYDRFGKHTAHNVKFLSEKGYSIRRIVKILDLPYQYVRKTKHNRVRAPKSWHIHCIGVNPFISS
jgi:hypothetical protein